MRNNFVLSFSLLIADPKCHEPHRSFPAAVPWLEGPYVVSSLGRESSPSFVRKSESVFSMIQPREEWRYHLENSNCFCIFFSAREEVARFLTDYSKAPAPLKAENVSQPTLGFVWFFFLPASDYHYVSESLQGTPCLTTSLSRFWLKNKWMSFNNCSNRPTKKYLQTRFEFWHPPPWSWDCILDIWQLACIYGCLQSSGCDLQCSSFQQKCPLWTMGLLNDHSVCLITVALLYGRCICITFAAKRYRKIGLVIWWPT